MQVVKGAALVVRLENGLPLLCGLVASARDRVDLQAAGYHFRAKREHIKMVLQTFTCIILP